MAEPEIQQTEVIVKQALYKNIIPFSIAFYKKNSTRTWSKFNYDTLVLHLHVDPQPHLFCTKYYLWFCFCGIDFGIAFFIIVLNKTINSQCKMAYFSYVCKALHGIQSIKTSNLHQSKKIIICIQRGLNNTLKSTASDHYKDCY